MRRLWHHLAVAVALGLLASAAAQAKPAVNGLRIGIHAETTRVVLDLTSQLEYKIFTLPDPYRVVIDLPEVDWRLPARRMEAGGGLVAQFRYGLFRPGTSRVVLDVEAPVEVRRAFLLRPTADFGPRLVLDLAAVSAARFRPQGEPPKPRPTPRPLPPRRMPRDDAARPVIVLDPGHGGVDPGAIGTSGIYEKDITLAAARQLKRRLEQSGHYKVVLTRTRDVFLRLRRRVEIARAAGADLFISLHADSIANRGVRGASVYTLSDQASDAVAAALAAKENKADLIAGVDLASEAYDNDVAHILIDLAQRETLNHSVQFANHLVPELSKEARLLGKSRRHAGFQVLKAPDVPSVLVELGFLSNRREERLLRESAYRRALMQAIVRAVESYFAQRRSASPT